MAESEEELKNLLMKGKEESKKAGLKLNIQKTKIMASSSIISWQIDGKTMETVKGFIFTGSKLNLPLLTSCWGFFFALGHKVFFLVRSNIPLGYDEPRQHIKKQTYYFANKGSSSQGYGLSSGHVRMWELNYKESWMQNWCFWTVVLEKTLGSPLDCKEIQPVYPKGNQSWVFIGRTDAEAETPIL